MREGRCQLICGDEASAAVESEPSDHVFCFSAQMNIVWEGEMVRPIDNLLVRVVCVLRAERRVSDQAFEHDCSE